MTNEDVIKMMQATIKGDGNIRIGLGILLLIIPAIFLLLAAVDIASDTFMNHWVDIVMPNVIFTIVLTLPGILFLRSGIRKRKLKYNEVYNTYINTPQNIARVYDEVVSINGRTICNVIIQTKMGKSLSISSNINQYRYLVRFLVARCPNAIEGKR